MLREKHDLSHMIGVVGELPVDRFQNGVFLAAYGDLTFEILRAGLPQDHAYDITFRHGLDIDATGTRLAFGSTTGSLWVSEDQGDSWATVSEHLPPIYALCFLPTA